MAFFLKPRPCTWDLPLDYHTAKQFEVDVTLDPATVGPEVVLSEDLKEATWGRPRCQWPEGPGRFDTDPCMLGSKGFTSGRHYWEVEANGRFWAVGVARESVQRKGRVLFKPNTEIWGLQKYDELCVALTAPSHTSVPLLNGEIGVYLDYEVKGENKDQFQMQCCPSQILSHCYLKFKKKCTFCGRGNTNQHLKNEKHGLTGEIEVSDSPTSMAAPHPPAKGQSNALRCLCTSSQSSERAGKIFTFFQPKHSILPVAYAALGLLWGLNISICYQKVSSRNRSLSLQSLQQLALVRNLMTYSQICPKFSPQIFKKDPGRAVTETKRFQIQCFWIFPPMPSKFSCLLTKSSMLSSIAKEAPSAEQLSWLYVQFPSTSEK
nr:uncharacterized protein LOC106629450 isoform X2 [Zonotrichia albicollis]XP_014123418.2 uncharacterized protein LOC106629450 isoform X2 [Zonotrichia albicollis]XP_026650161.1 uncharacterized protein LOC106629450 isoform X2 [Zonotrichia albicollis]